MAYDSKLAERVRRVLARRRGVEEKKMFGGVAFMLRGHMCCGVLEGRLIVRVGPAAHAEALARPHAAPMDLTGHSLKGFVFVEPEGLRTSRALAVWVERGVVFVKTLPPKGRRI